MSIISFFRNIKLAKQDPVLFGQFIFNGIECLVCHIINVFFCLNGSNGSIRRGGYHLA